MRIGFGFVRSFGGGVSVENPGWQAVVSPAQPGFRVWGLGFRVSGLASEHGGPVLVNPQT